MNVGSEGVNDGFVFDWLYVLIFYALLILLVVWVVVGIDHLGKSRMSWPWFLTISISISVLYLFVTETADE